MDTLSFAEVQKGLCDHFEGETMGHVRALQRLKQGTTPLGEFNTKFSTTAAPALSQLSTITVKDLYMQSLSNSKTRDAVAMNLHLPLQ